MGKLCIYGFGHRRSSSCAEGHIVNSTNVNERILWEDLADKGLESVMVGLPEAILRAP
jgi:predicted AlkP superfamily phosphohydrolase/phosphomutase